VLKQFRKAVVPAFIRCATGVVCIGCVAACGSDPDPDQAEGQTDDTNDYTHTNGGQESDSGSDSANDAEGKTTGATCPSANAPTYDNFGAAFLQAHCTRCHSSAQSGSDRNGATPNYNFDTLAGVIQHAEEIERLAAAGPKATNSTMPPAADGPSLEERQKLGQWVVCLITGVETAD
jgi:hypothetical protein